MRALTAANDFQQNSQVVPERLKLVGYCDNRPTQGNHTAEGRRGNRRIEIILLAPVPPAFLPGYIFSRILTHYRPTRWL